MQKQTILLLTCLMAYPVYGEKAEPTSQNVTEHNVAEQERHKCTVYVKPQDVLKQSDEFNERKRQIQNDIQNQAKQLQDKAQQLAQDREQMQNEIYSMQNGSKSKFTSDEARQKRLAELSEQQAELEKQENNIKYDYQRVQDKSKREEQNLQMEMWDKMQKAAEIVGHEQGWGAIDMASMYVAPSLDITDDVAKAMNKTYRESKQTKQHAASQTEQAAQYNTEATS